MARLINVLYSIDVCLFSILSLGGSSAESFSSAAYRAEGMGIFYGKARPVIDWIFELLGQREHCKQAYFSAKLNLPEDMR